MSIETEHDLIGLRKIGGIVARCLKHMGSRLEPGMTTFELDEVGRTFLEFYEARSAPKLTYNFPGTTCISVNEEAAHGIPGYFDPADKRVLKRNQVITIEPFLSTGATEVFDTGDGWTLSTSKSYLTAQYEHTIVITNGAPLIMTLAN